MKIFRPVLQIYKKIVTAFPREQGNAALVKLKQKAAINREKPGYNGNFGTPEGIRTPDTRLRRAVLCPAELLAHMQFLFVSVTPAVENPPNVRRRTLYPGEVRGHIQKIFNFAGLQDSNDSIFRRRTLYPGEVRGHIQKIFNYEGLWGSNGSIVRRRPLYTAELRGHRKMRTVDSPAYGAQGTGSYYHSVFGGKSQLACKKLQRSSQ